MASQLRQGFDEIWHQGNMSFIDENFSPELVFHDVFSGDIDREGFKQHVRTFRNAFPDIRFHLDDIIVAGDFATVRWTSTSTHLGELKGLAPTGRSVTTSGILLLRYDGEQVREIWGYWDVFGMLRQMGVALRMEAEAGVQSPAEADRPSPEAHH
jgi:hypothetical protein